ncbi:MAG: hypothetical protein RI894_2674, partial [Bacteroidota bacterium]
MRGFATRAAGAAFSTALHSSAPAPELETT